MKNWIFRTLIILFFTLAGNGLAAQPYHNLVGDCYDRVKNISFPILEYTTVTYGGFTYKMTKLVVHQYGSHQPPTFIDAVPDPSGIHLLAVRSGIPGLQFWIARNGDFITINYQGFINKVGECRISPTFANQFPRPITTPPTSFEPYSMGFDGSVLAQDLPDENLPVSMLHSGNIPAQLFGEDFHISNPVLIKESSLPMCLTNANGNSNKFYDCILKQSLGSKEKQIYECQQNSLSKNEMALCLLSINLGGQERADLERVRQCYAEHQTNWNAYPICLAEDRIDPNIINVVECARQNFQQGQQPNYWTLGACTFGPMLWGQLNPNTESTIAIECAMQTGGNPKLFATCTGGRLLANELDKCLTHGVGDQGCFGKNNTISQTYQRIDDELVKALGKDNPAYTAWRAARLASDPAMMARAVKDVNREIARLGTNIEDETNRALNKFGAEISKVVPRVKVGKPKGKIFGNKWSL